MCSDRATGVVVALMDHDCVWAIDQVNLMLRTRRDWEVWDMLTYDGLAIEQCGVETFYVVAGSAPRGPSRIGPFPTKLAAMVAMELLATV